jgi:hypothetical protein
MGQLFYVATIVSLLAWMLYALISAQAVVSQFNCDRWLIVMIVAAILISTPIGITYYVSNSHHLEIINLLTLAIFTIIILLRPGPGLGLGILISFSVVSVLVHESALLSTIPAAFVIYFLMHGKHVGRFSHAVLVGVYVICISLVVIAGQNSRQMAEKIVDSAIQRTDNELASAIKVKRDDKIDVLRFTLIDNIKKGLGSLKKPRHYTRLISCFLVAAPALFFLSVILVSRLRWPVAAVTVAIGLLPLSLSVLADDVFRWLILAVIGLAVLNLVPASAQFVREEWSERAKDGATLTPTVGLGVVALITALVLPYPNFMSNDGNPLYGTVLNLWALAMGGTP